MLKTWGGVKCCGVRDIRSGMHLDMDKYLAAGTVD